MEHFLPSVYEFYVHFKSLNSNTVTDNRFDDINSSVMSNPLLNDPFSEAEVMKCILKLQNAKASSPHDNIINECIKTTIALFLPIYSQLFNSVLDTGSIIHSWLKGITVPIYKNKGDPKDPTHYRQITILSCLGKLLILF